MEMDEEEKEKKLIAAIRLYTKAQRIAEKANSDLNDAIGVLKNISGASGHGGAVYDGAIQLLGKLYLNKEVNL